MKIKETPLQHADAKRQPKNMGLAIALAAVFGPFGLLYVSAIGGIAILLFGAVITLFIIHHQNGFISLASFISILVVSYVVSVLLAFLRTKLHNQQLVSDQDDDTTAVVVHRANLLYRVQKLFAVLLMLVISLGVVAYYMYNKPHQNVANSTPVKVLTADEFYGSIKDKDSLTVASFTNKIYEVKGVVSSINPTSDSSFNILLVIGTTGTDNVNCAMDPQYNARLKNLKAGDKLSIKGIFSGVNNWEDKDLGISTHDLIMTRAVAIRE